MFNFKEFRRDNCILQSELAELLNLTQPQISRIENNGGDLTKSQREKLYEKYGKEDVDRYIVASGNIMNGNGEQVNGINISGNSNLVSIIESQQKTIEHQISVQNDVIQQLLASNERLTALIEKMNNAEDL